MLQLLLEQPPELLCFEHSEYLHCGVQVAFLFCDFVGNSSLFLAPASFNVGISSSAPELLTSFSTTSRGVNPLRLRAFTSTPDLFTSFRFSYSGEFGSRRDM